jgi:hypothetical protein
MVYSVPKEHFFRIHHVRPRFKNDVESVLLFMCQRITNLEKQVTGAFDQALFTMIQSYPGNFEKADKTIHNWRTEISSLFGLVVSDEGQSESGFYAQLLAKNEDLIEFFRYFLLTFQYPGGHIKPAKIAEQISSGVSFHPAKFIIDTFFEGQKILGDEKPFSITAAELTALAFNDLRVTATKEHPAEIVAQAVVKNRLDRVQYDQTGDVVRYAQDILDYMVLADILTRRVNTNSYYLKSHGHDAALKISQRAPMFTGYKGFYGKQAIETRQIAQIEDDWFSFVNEDRLSDAFVGDILSILETEDASFNIKVEELVDSLRQALVGDARDIGRAGESVAISHEVQRLTALQRMELAKKVRKIPDHLGVGYDLLSFEGVIDTQFGELNRYIEVKTTRSKSRLVNNSFTLTPNEWNAARSHGETYFVYRIIISEGDLRMFVINNPYEQERKGAIVMTPRNGAEISYTEASGHWEEILVSDRAVA